MSLADRSFDSDGKLCVSVNFVKYDHPFWPQV